MSTFGIREAGLGDSGEHYVGEDPSLWDWILASNYEATDDPALLRVQAPAGYNFLFGGLYFIDPKDGGDDFILISSKSPQDHKASAALESLRFVTSAEFHASGINADRILEIEIH